MVLSSFIYFYPPYFFCKVNANERNGKEILSFYLLRSMISIIFLPSSYHLYIFLHAIFISIFRPCPKSFLRLRSIPIKSPHPPLPPFSYIKKWGSEQAQHPSLPHSLYIKSKDKNHSLYISSEIKIILYISLPRIKIILYPRAKKSPSFHLLLRHKSFPSLVIIEDANLGNFPLLFVSYFDSCLRIIIWCTINTLSSLKQSAIILWGRRGA